MNREQSSPIVRGLNPPIEKIGNFTYRFNFLALTEVEAPALPGRRLRPGGDAGLGQFAGFIPQGPLVLG